MSALAEIDPKDRRLIIDLVRAAGVSVSDWGNFKGGERNAARNPKYCYEWSFVEPKKVVVLNLWYASMQERDGVIVQDLNLREIAHRFGRLLNKNKAVWARRSLNMDRAIQTAVRDRLPIRVVVCEGEMRDIDDPGGKASQVNKRLLDPVSWAVTAYDGNTGKCTVTRGALADRFVDQFSVPQESASQAERRPVSGQAFVRNPEIRKRVLRRAKGKCKWCAQPGFTMADGKVYLETHHVIPLGEGGADIGGNVVALCPNHHREAHHGANSPEMRKSLLDRLVVFDAEPPLQQTGLPLVEL
jgi:5-methylcytosine-specific restriction protein A